MGQCFFESEALTIGRRAFVGARGSVVGATTNFGQKMGEANKR
ncbi:hypothetical protein [Alloprevotella tannerae]|nr:hypothetical protein [Alloprevotella tannerae]